ncbi:uncharacterized protein B4U80_04340, partial [Leptotrombidium deliense]
YLDLRVMFRPETQDGEKHLLWIAHDKVQMNNTLDSVLKQIRQFLDATSKEIVIIDFHRFPLGFETDKINKHKILLKMLEVRLKPYLSPNNKFYKVTVDELVKSGKRVIIGYAEQDVKMPYLYPRVKHLWANTDHIDFLYKYLKDSCRRDGTFATSAMAELTPKPAEVVFNVYGGLRKMADGVNSEVTKWFRDHLWNCANIVATDFFLGNNIIEVSITVNSKSTILGIRH